MDIIEQIKAQVISDVQPLLGASFTVFNGVPQSIQVADDEYSDDELPAVAVFVSDAQVTDESFDSEEWAGVLHVVLYDVSSNQVEQVLNGYSETVHSVVTRDYTANGLLLSCARSSLASEKDNELPWGMLDLMFNIEWETN